MLCAKHLIKVSLIVLTCWAVMAPLAEAKKTTTTSVDTATSPPAADTTTGADSATGVQLTKRIVVFRDGTSQQERLQYASQWQSFGVTVLMDLPFINGMALGIPETVSADDLAVDPRVTRVEAAQQMSLQALTATADGGAADGGAADGGAADGGAASFIQAIAAPPSSERSWGQLRLCQLPYDPWALTDYWSDKSVPAVIRTAAFALMSGTPLRIAIFDSGVDSTHPLLSGVVKGGIDLVSLTNDGFAHDESGHGTHVAATLCGRTQKGQSLGTVPGAEIYSVKVLDHNAIGDISSLLMGLQWAIENHMDVVNLSLAYAEDHPAVRLAVQQASAVGLIIVAAAGNHSNWDLPAPTASADGGAADGGAADGGAADGGAADGGAADGGALSADGADNTSPYPVMYPAKYPEVIGVGAEDAFGELALFSNTGAEVDVLAPGTNIVSAALGGGYGICSGTSMAVPHVTAAVILMKALDRSLTPEEIRNILKGTAQNGEINLVNALNTVLTR